MPDPIWVLFKQWPTTFILVLLQTMTEN